MKTNNMKTYKTIIMATSLIAWIYVFVSDWKIGLSLFSILWANNMRK